MEPLIVVGGAIVLLDTILIATIPILLIMGKRPGLALASSLIIGTLVIVDGEVNFESVSYPPGLSILGLPAEVLPLSVFIIMATALLCVWAVSRNI